jgi:hypothetical protein
MMVERLGKGEEKYGGSVGSLVVVVIIVLCADHHPLPSPTTAAFTIPPRRCHPHSSSPRRCVSLLCELVSLLSLALVVRRMLLLLLCALALVVRCALLLCCVQSLSLARGGWPVVVVVVIVLS